MCNQRSNVEWKLTPEIWMKRAERMIRSSSFTEHRKELVHIKQLIENIQSVPPSKVKRMLEIERGKKGRMEA